MRMLLDHPAVDVSCLELEILETSAVQDFAHVSLIIEAFTLPWTSRCRLTTSAWATRRSPI